MCFLRCEGPISQGSIVYIVVLNNKIWFKYLFLFQNET